MQEPVVILSDLHLGHKVSRVDDVGLLRPLIAGAGTVIFNGDTWQPLAAPFRERSERMLVALQELCREAGAGAVFLSGNHDPDWPGDGWVELAGGKIVVTHGDTLMRASSPWKREVFGAPERVEEIWREHPVADHDLRERIVVSRQIARELRSVKYSKGRHAIKRLWDAITPPERALEIVQAWWSQGEAGARFCRTYFPQAELLIIGHFHHFGMWAREGVRVVDLGTFVHPGKSGWAEWSDGMLRVGEVDERVRPYSRGRVRGVWRFAVGRA